MYKKIILGAPLTGKTTLTNYLRDELSLPVLDMDQELVRLNDGKWPGNHPQLNERLINQAIADVLSRDEVIFSGFFFGIEELRKARKLNFEIIQLETDMETIITRNKERLKKQPDNDAFKYYEKNLEYQDKIRELDLVDRIIGSNRPVKSIVEELLKSTP